MEDVMAKPKSLSIGQISHAAKASVDKLREHHAKLLPPDPVIRIGFVPPRWWYGFVIFDPITMDNTSLADVRKLAGSVHEDIARAVPDVRGGKAGISFDDDLLTIGFAPPPDVNVFEA
jgi:hypothetical protein